MPATSWVAFTKLVDTTETPSPGKESWAPGTKLDPRTVPILFVAHWPLGGSTDVTTGPEPLTDPEAGNWTLTATVTTRVAQATTAILARPLMSASLRSGSCSEPTPRLRIPAGLDSDKPHARTYDRQRPGEVDRVQGRGRAARRSGDGRMGHRRCGGVPRHVRGRLRLVRLDHAGT